MATMTTVQMTCDMCTVVIPPEHQADNTIDMSMWRGDLTVNVHFTLHGSVVGHTTYSDRELKDLCYDCKKSLMEGVVAIMTERGEIEDG